MKRLYITPLFYAIGNAAEEILWAHARSNLLQKKLNIIAPYSCTEILDYKICNKELFRVVVINEKKLDRSDIIIKSIFQFIVNLFFFLRRLISIVNRRYIHLHISSAWNFLAIGQQVYWPVPRDRRFHFDDIKVDPIITAIHNLPPIILRNRTHLSCVKNLSEYGIPIGARFVCLHVRDSGYHNDPSRRDYRNANIINYHKAIKFLVENGLYIFRMGDNKMNDIGIKHPNIIDYPFTKLKSENMDLFLIKNCEFYIGMQSGITDVAVLFNKPILMVNMYSWFFGYPLKNYDRGMFKSIKIRHEKHGSVLTIMDQFAFPYNYTNPEEILSDDLEYIENSPDEIHLATQDFFSNYKLKFTKPISKSQYDIYKVYRKASDSIMKNENPEKSNSFFSLPPVERVRIALRNLSSVGALYDFKTIVK